MVANTHFIVNPNSGGGSVGKNWDSIRSKIQDKIGQFNYSYTEMKGSGSSLATKLSKDGIKTLCIIGGDGTISEIIDGVMRATLKPNLCILNLGTGGDFCKTLGVPGDLNLAIQKMLENQTQAVDVGKVTYTNERDGTPQDRYFINIIGCGMDGAVVRSVNKSSKRFGGFSYYLGSLENVLSYKNKPIRFRLDSGEWMERKITTLAICNGQYFGGGMRVSPNSELSDGYFDITLLNDWNFFAKAFHSKNFYNGTILTSPNVESFRCKIVEIEPIGSEDPAIIDCDGEDIGIIPMKVEIIKQAIHFFV